LEERVPPKTRPRRAPPPRKSRRSKRAVDPVLAAKLQFAWNALAAGGTLAGARSKRLSARVDPGLIEAARRKTGIGNDSDLINAALAVMAAPDDFGAWFAAQAGRLPKDFELEL
jgi:hypothetical protein